MKIEDTSHVWVPGSVFTSASRQERIEPGQTWTLPVSKHKCCFLTVVATTLDGEVQFRPLNDEQVQLYNERYPDTPFEKGSADPGPPFKRVDARMAKGDPRLKEGDLLCHQAWSCWQTLSNDQGGAPH